MRTRSGESQETTSWRDFRSSSTRTDTESGYLFSARSICDMLKAEMPPNESTLRSQSDAHVVGMRLDPRGRDAKGKMARDSGGHRPRDRGPPKHAKRDHNNNKNNNNHKKKTQRGPEAAATTRKNARKSGEEKQHASPNANNKNKCIKMSSSNTRASTTCCCVLV